MYCVTPVALATGMFSMNEKVMPFIPPTFQSFLGLSFAFAFIGLSLHLWQQRYWRKRANNTGQVRRLTQATTELDQAVSTYLQPRNQDDLEQGGNPTSSGSEQGTHAGAGRHGSDDTAVAEDRSTPGT